MAVSAQSASAASRRTAGRRSPLRVATMEPADFTGQPATQPPAVRREVSAAELRKMKISEFSQWLGTQTNKWKRPFQAGAIRDYTDAARVLHRWMSEQGIDADFTACDTEILNRFFAWYRQTHSQGGTNTRQRNLHHLFKWLARKVGTPDPWADPDLVRYSPSEVSPATLHQECISDLLKVTGDGRATDPEDIRDHAIIRVLTEGVRRTELTQIELHDLSADLIAQPFIRVVPLKGARAQDQGRLVPLCPATARAIVSYLGARRSHRLATSSFLWLGRRGPLTGSGVARMLDRRTEQADWDPVHMHQFRHTFANDWLDGGGAEGDLMRLMGWKDRSMVDRYAADMQVRRAIAAKQRRGEMYGTGAGSEAHS
jgi:integrase/recombinase XerD